MFTSFDALKGRGAEIARFELEAGAPDYNWAISPDASAIAILKPGDNRIRILSLTGQPPEIVSVTHWTNLAGVYWGPDGKGCFTINKDKGGVTLLYVDQHGKGYPLLQLDGYSSAYAIPSPDGRHLAIVATSRTNNVWLMENF